MMVLDWLANMPHWTVGEWALFGVACVAIGALARAIFARG